MRVEVRGLSGGERTEWRGEVRMEERGQGTEWRREERGLRGERTER